MDRVNILCSKDSVLMNEFSRRCIDKMKDHFMFRVFFSVFHDFMDANVKKETDKDRLIIENAVRVYESGKNVGDIDTEAIFEKTKAVDERFIKKISVLPLLIDIRYEDIKDIRKKRIKILSLAVFELLNNWSDSIPFVDVVKKTYREKQFEEIIKEMLHLYNLETMKLTNSIKLLYPLNMAKDLLSTTLFYMMEHAKKEISRESIKKIYGGICQKPT